MTGQEHHDNRRVPRPQSDDMILNGLRFDHYELTLPSSSRAYDYLSKSSPNRIGEAQPTLALAQPIETQVIFEGRARAQCNSLFTVWQPAA